MAKHHHHRPATQPQTVAIVPAEAGLRYSVISDVNYDTFCERIQAAADIGWRLQGGVAIGEYHDPVTGLRRPGWHQAMVKGG